MSCPGVSTPLPEVLELVEGRWRVGMLWESFGGKLSSGFRSSPPNPFFLRAWKSTEWSGCSQIPHDMPGHFWGRPRLGTSHAGCCQRLAFQVHIARQEEEAWQGTFSYPGSLRSIKEALGPEGRRVSRYLWLPLLQSPPKPFAHLGC